jgi:DNA-binding beta-propeller fold protein YncE
MFRQGINATLSCNGRSRTIDRAEPVMPWATTAHLLQYRGEEMRSLRQSRPGAPNWQPPTLRSLEVAAGLGLLLAAGLLISASACAPAPTIPDHFSSGSNDVCVIDTRTNRVVIEARLPCGTGAFNVATSPDEHTVYVADPGLGHAQ